MSSNAINRSNETKTTTRHIRDVDGMYIIQNGEPRLISWKDIKKTIATNEYVTPAVTAASGITFSPTGTIAATNVQTAIQEAASEAVQLTGNQTITGNISVTGTIGSTGNGSVGGNLTVTGTETITDNTTATSGTTGALTVGGSVGIGGGVVYSSNVKTGQYHVNALNIAPSTATDTGTLGDIKVSDTSIAVAVATNTWRFLTYDRGEHPGYVSGRYYVANFGQSTTSAAYTTTGTIYYTPVYIARHTTIDALVINVIGAGASVKSWIGLYTSVDGTPTTLIATPSAEADLSTTGFKTVTLSSNAVLSKGIYWLAFTQNLNTSVTMMTAGGFDYLRILGATAPTTANPIVRLSATFTYGTLPSTAPITGLATSITTGIYAMFRVA